MSRDVYRFINEADAATVEGLIKRLEFRATDARFNAMRDAYFDHLKLSDGARVLDLGCGTGVVARALARRTQGSVSLIAIDQSAPLIQAGRERALAEGVSEWIEFRVGDALQLTLDTGAFDVVIGHTLISHVADPPACLRQMAEVVQPSGQVAIFDGDYASLTFGHPDGDLAQRMDDALIATVVNSPRIMRDLPHLLPSANLAIEWAAGYVYEEIGQSSFWTGAVESYGPLIARGGLAPAIDVERWMEWQRTAAAEGTFFASCNYYTYLARRRG